MEDITKLLNEKQYSELCELFESFMHYTAILKKRPVDILRVLDAAPDDLGQEVKIAGDALKEGIFTNDLAGTYFSLPYQGDNYKVHLTDDYRIEVYPIQPTVTNKVYLSYNANPDWWNKLTALEELGLGDLTVAELSQQIKIIRECRSKGEALTLTLTPQEALTELKDDGELMVTPYGDEPIGMFVGIYIADFEDQEDEEIIKQLGEYDRIEQWLHFTPENRA